MAARLAELLPRLNERDRRLALGSEAKAWGRGGIAEVHRVTGRSRTTIGRGIGELSASEGDLGTGRVRAAGGGRKKAQDADPQLAPALDALIEPGTRGDPESPIRWTTKSTRNLAEELTASGHPVSASVVGKILRLQGYSLQGTRKTLEGAQHPDRDAQFRYIGAAVAAALAAGQPVISVDTKKKELVGRFAQAGADWRRSGDPVQVSTYDFPHLADGKAIPYGVYDIADDSAWVSVGVDHDTSVFAVATIEKWWEQLGRDKIPQRHHPADHRRRRRVQRPPALAMEIRTRPPGRNDRPDHHRRALPTRHLEMEQNRAPAVLPDHRELARPPPDHLPDRRQSHLQHHHPHRARRPMRTRPQHLPHQDETHRPTEERHPHHPPRLPPRLELHDQQSPMKQVISIRRLTAAFAPSGAFTNTSAMSKVVYERPKPKPNSGSMSCAWNQRYPISNPSE